MLERGPARTRRRFSAAFGLVLWLCLLPGCTYLAPLLGRSPDDAAAKLADDAAFYRNARDDRTTYLEREVTRLRADLKQAEEAMVAIESGLRGSHTRADAVSSLAEARIEVERASRGAPWRRDEVLEAQAKLDEAERQLQAGHSGSAVFFASRARRMATNLNEEAKQVASNESTRFVRAQRVNLRAGPSVHERIVDVLSNSTPVFPERRQGKWILVRTVSGPAGWVHADLLRPE